MNLDPLPPVIDLLPPARTELVVMTDTHLVDSQAVHAGEFESRLRQNDRISAALRVAAGTPSSALVHLGDLVQDYPENETHAELLREAVEQVRAIAERVYFAPGNTDVGDKADPSSPAALASAETMERFDHETGAAWGSFDAGEVHGVVLAASLFNSGLELEDEQWSWLEEDLAASAGATKLLFFHYPLFLRAENDPGIGNYDVISQPARGRLLDVIRQRRIAAVFTGHSHYSFVHGIGAARAYGVPSTSFTRPGFSELFSSCPPPDRGRDDVPKLGFHLVRVHDDGLRIHQVRSGELSAHLERHASARPVVSCVPKDVPSSRLGVVLRHPIAQAVEVPDTFPSVVRQPVRNDYPLLACLELGARYVSVAAADATDPHLAERLEILRSEGVDVVARVVWTAGTTPEIPEGVDEVELVLLDRSLLSAADRQVLRGLADRPYLMSTLMRGPRGSRELPRWRYGFTADEAVMLDESLPEGVTARVLLSADSPSVIDDHLRRTSEHSWSSISGVDLVYPLESEGEGALERLCEAFLHSGEAAGPRFFVDGLSELDRTLTVSPGLLDRACNPRPAFHALRVLNSLLYAGPSVRFVRGEGGVTVERHGLEGEVLIRPAEGDEREVIELSTAIAVKAAQATGPVVRLTTKEGP